MLPRQTQESAALLQEQAAQAAFFAEWKNVSPIPKMEILSDLVYMAQSAVETDQSPHAALELMHCFIAYFKAKDPEKGKPLLEELGME